MDILLVDDHAAMREELASVLATDDELKVVGQATNGEEGVLMAKALRPDIILMDVVMPGMNGIDATTAIRAAVPNARVLAISNHTGQSLVTELLHAGATGYIRKDRAYEELVPAIRAVAAGKSYIGEHVSD